MKLTFWLLDLNYETKTDTPGLWMWGIDNSGHRVLIIDRDFKSYFYAIPKAGTGYEKADGDIKSRVTDLSQILKTEFVEKKYFGKPLGTVKITVQNPDVLPKYARIVKGLEVIEDCVEDDIRFSMRYLIDNEVSPCDWYEIEVQKTDNEAEVLVDEVYVAKSFPKRVAKTEVPKLRILGFSTICYSKQGMPKPSKDPIVIMSIATNDGEEKQFVSKNSADETIIKDFVDYVRRFDPDIIVGFGTNRQDWPYLIERAKKLNLKLHVDRAGAEPHTSVYGHISITGRANVDLFDFTDELPEIKLKTLENVADYLDVMKLEERTIIEDIEYAAYWEDRQKRKDLLKFSEENTQSIMGVADTILDFALQLSSLVSLPLDHIGTAAVGFRVEWYLAKSAHRISELIPKRMGRPYIPYVGGIVLEPKVGLHENVAVLDFKAMYPSLMIAHNLSPDTYVSNEKLELQENMETAPGTKHGFRKKPPGFYNEVLSSLINERDAVRVKLEKLSSSSPEYRVLDARQRAVKVIANATYGYAGWIGARWYSKPVAEAAAAWGRYTIQETIDTAQKKGLDVVYGDTDSIFIKYESEKVARLTKEIERNLSLEIKPDKIYLRILFTEAKKRYCGLSSDGKLDIVGLEVIRGDWADVARKCQERVLEILLKDKEPKKAVKFVQQYITDLRAKKAPYRDLIIWKTLTKPVEKYAVKAPHVEAARILKDEGWEISSGDKVGFVITTGAGRLYTRAKPFMLASYEEIDIGYYVTNQVVPAVARILSVFGVKEEELLPSTKTLDRFLP